MNLQVSHLYSSLFCSITLGIERHERSICPDSNEIQSQQNNGGNSLDSNGSAGSGDQGHMPCQGHHSTNNVNIQPLIFRSAFSELREMSPLYSNQFQSKNKYIHANDSENRHSTCLSSDETKWSSSLAISMPVTVGNLLSEESSYSCSPVVDPFWPLCMYELRGKCNNDECPWQHVKDYGDGNIYQHQHTDSNNAGIEVNDNMKPTCFAFFFCYIREYGALISFSFFFSWLGVF